MNQRTTSVIKLDKLPGVMGLAVILTLFIFVAATPVVLAGESDEEHVSPHQVSLFLGNTQNGSENGFSIGLEYEYRWSRYFGTGAMIEYAGGDHEAWVAGIPFFVFPYAGWFFQVAPGVEHEEEENSALVRAGLGYEFEFKPKWSLAPEFNVDMIEGGESKLIYGITLSREF